MQTFKHSKKMFFLKPATSKLVFEGDSLSLTDKGVEVQRGKVGRWFAQSRTSKLIPYSKINNVEYKQIPIARLLNIGDIVIFSGNDEPEVFDMVDNPEHVTDLIKEKLDQ